MLNIDKIETVYLACGYTDLRKSIDGLAMMVQGQFKLSSFDKALFVFCNRQMDKLKFSILTKVFGYIIIVWKEIALNGQQLLRKH